MISYLTDYRAVFCGHFYCSSRWRFGTAFPSTAYCLGPIAICIRSWCIWLPHRDWPNWDGPFRGECPFTSEEVADHQRDLIVESRAREAGHSLLAATESHYLSPDAAPHRLNRPLALQVAVTNSRTIRHAAYPWAIPYFDETARAVV